MSWWEWGLLIVAGLVLQNYIDELRARISVLTDRVDRLEQRIQHGEPPEADYPDEP